jgi:hypothetical protein
MSGVAKIMAQVLDDEYCAGLWRSCLVTELAWSWTGDTEPASLPTGSSTYRAPSWSWASLNSGIWHYNLADNTIQIPLIDIILCDVKTATADRTCAVVSGILRLSGWLATIQIYGMTNYKSDFFVNGKRWKDSCRFSFIMGYALPTLSTLRFHCLPLFLARGLGGIPATRMYGLLLVPTGTVVGQFRRVDCCKFHESKELGKCEDFPQFFNEPWMEYDEASGDNKYTISII